jgi:hypothetical protein
MAHELLLLLRDSQRTLFTLCPTMGRRITGPLRRVRDLPKVGFVGTVVRDPDGAHILMASNFRYWSAVLAGLVFSAHPWAIANDGAVPGILAVVVHKMSKIDNVTLSDVRRMFTGDLRAWPDGSLVVVIEQPAESPTQQRTLRILLKTTPANYNRQLLQTHFQGKQLPTIKVLNSDASAIRFVLNLPGAITVVDGAATVAAPAGVKILRIDGKLPGEMGYPLQ